MFLWLYLSLNLKILSTNKRPGICFTYFYQIHSRYVENRMNRVIGQKEIFFSFLTLAVGERAPTCASFQKWWRISCLHPSSLHCGYSIPTCNRSVENTYSLLLEKICSSCLLATKRQPQAPPPRCVRARVCFFRGWYILYVCKIKAGQGLLCQASSAYSSSYTQNLNFAASPHYSVKNRGARRLIWNRIQKMYIHLLSLKRFGTDYKVRCNVALIHTKLSKGLRLFDTKEFNILYKTHCNCTCLYTLYMVTKLKKPEA